MRISGYRLMWLMVMFDLPVMTREDRRNYRRFVDWLEDDGFIRIQFSVYTRPSATEENTQAHVDRLLDRLPPAGEVRVLKFTDKQWGRMLVVRERRLGRAEEAPEQLVFFDDALEPVVEEPGGLTVREAMERLVEESLRNVERDALSPEPEGDAVSDLPREDPTARAEGPAFVAEERKPYDVGKRMPPPPPKKGRGKKAPKEDHPTLEFFD